MYNKQTIIGNMGKDLESKEISGGGSVCRFSMASTEKWKDKEHTEWFYCVAFGKLADIIAKYGHKGMKVFVEGRTETSNYTDKDGNEKQSRSVIVNTFKMLGSKSDGGGQFSAKPAQAAKPATPAASNVDDFDDDIPF